ATSLQISVHFDTLAGTALAGVDFVATSGDLVFAAGETTKTVTVSLVNDTLVEPTESFSLKLSGAVNATISNDTATGTIIDNDVAPPPLPSFSVGDLSRNEGDGTLTFMVTK